MEEFLKSLPPLVDKNVDQLKSFLETVKRLEGQELDVRNLVASEEGSVPLPERDQAEIRKRLGLKEGDKLSDTFAKIEDQVDETTKRISDYYNELNQAPKATAEGERYLKQLKDIQKEVITLTGILKRYAESVNLQRFDVDVDTEQSQKDVEQLTRRMQNMFDLVKKLDSEVTTRAGGGIGEGRNPLAIQPAQFSKVLKITEGTSTQIEKVREEITGKNS